MKSNGEVPCVVCIQKDCPGWSSLCAAILLDQKQGYKVMPTSTAITPMMMDGIQPIFSSAF